MKKIRIFISSPGDVQEERDIARGVVQQLGRTFAGRLQLQAVLWEELALGADMSFQQGIDTVLSEQGIEIAVFILWSRLGSPTGLLMVGDQGKPFRSGTEREWYLMLQAREACIKRGLPPRPQIIVYNRKDETSFEERLRGKTDEHKATDVQQKLALAQFIEEEFHDANSGVNVRAYHSFDQPTTFAKQLRTHLTNLLESSYGVELERPYWNVADLGPPFRGLDVFEFEHSPIFFGREDELVAIRNRLREQACRGCAFLLISGASGSGKSSLARAGVLPDIVSHEIDGDISKWRWCTLKPNQLGEGLLSGLVRSLLSKEVLPELENWSDDLVIPTETSRQKEWSTRFMLRIKDALNACGSKRGATRLLILIDQMEELFSSATQTAESIQQFFEVLEDLARSGCVWIVATVRSDFYHECQKVSALVRMKDGAGQYDLLPPASDSLIRVVTGPAHLAGLRFEKDGEQSLADLIIRESAGCSELLPLVEYLLLDLFEHRTADSVLTFARYRELGGLEGALRHRCEDTFTRLPADAQGSLPAVLSKLVTLSGDDLNTAVRRAVPWERFQANPAELALVDAMVAQRLFTTYSDSDGTKVVSVIHEAVLRIWPRVSQWTDQNRGFLRIRSRVEQSQSRWTQQQDDSLLLAKGVPLSEGCQLRDEASHLLDPETKDYIERSSAFHKAESLRRKRIRIGTAIMAGMLLIGLGWYAWGVQNRTVAEGLVNAMMTANPVELERLIDKELPNHRSIADGLLRTLSDENQTPESKPGLHARLGLLPVDKTVLESLQQTLITIPEPEYLALIVRTIKANKLTVDLWPQFHDATLEPDQRFRAGLTLANLEPDASQWTGEDASFLVERLVQSNPIYQSTYNELLAPISQRLIEPLRVVFTAESSSQVQQLASANAIAAFAKNQPELLPEFLIVATPEQYNILYPGLADAADSRNTLSSILRTEPGTDLPQSDRISLGIRRAGAAITLLRTGERAGIFDIFRVTKDPESLSQFVARCKARGVTVSQLLECVDACDLKRQAVTGKDRTLDDRVLFGLLLALGDYSRDTVPELKQESLKTRLAKWYETDPSSTVHGATGWLLRQWGYSDELSKVDQTPLPYDPSGQRDWFTLEIKVADQPLYFTFIVFPAGEYQLGSPPDESKRQNDETVHAIKLSRPLAICDRELTWAQFDLSDDGELHKGVDKQFARKSVGNDPTFGQNWFDSVTYCRWLSSQMGLREEAQCYDDPANLEQDEQGNPKYSEIYLEGAGFRLPTEAEWEVVSRVGTSSAYSFGSDQRLLESYGWFQQNSNERSHPTAELRPNLNGLYDVHGNLLEWCHDWYFSNVEDGSIDPTGATRGADRVYRGGGWNYVAASCRAAYRSTDAPTYRSIFLGFRLALSPSSESSKTSNGEAEPVGAGTEGAPAEQRPEMP